MGDFKQILILIITISSLSVVCTIENTDTADMNPTETQRAECTLISGDVKASAEATVSRKLEGFCATDHMSRAFINLENRMLSELNHMRAMINLLLPPLYQQHYFAQPQPLLYQPIQSQSSNDQSSIPTQTQLGNGTESSVSNLTDAIQNESPLSGLEIDNQGTTEPLDTFEAQTEKTLEFRPVQKKQNHRPKLMQKSKTGPRDFEIHKFNNTILSGGDLQIFTYYWKIEEFSIKLKSNKSFVHSPIFTISGLHLRVKATFNHLERDYLYLQLESIEMDNNSKSPNIILKSGDLFKKIEPKKFLKHKIAILDQVTPTSDLISQDFNNTMIGFLVPNNAILTAPYSKNDNLLVKVIITL